MSASHSFAYVRRMHVWSPMTISTQTWPKDLLARLCLAVAPAELNQGYATEM